jgi:hypothetical protein
VSQEATARLIGQGGGAIPQPRGYTLWIEAEEWAPGEWSPADDNTDVIVTFDDASCWAATFLSYANSWTLTENNRRTGEYLAGAYLWASDMILVDEVNRLRIEKVGQHHLQEGNFEAVFTRLPLADPADNDEAN